MECFLLHFQVKSLWISIRHLWSLIKCNLRFERAKKISIKAAELLLLLPFPFYGIISSVSQILYVDNVEKRSFIRNRMLYCAIKCIMHGYWNQPMTYPFRELLHELLEIKQEPLQSQAIVFLAALTLSLWTCSVINKKCIHFSWCWFCEVQFIGIELTEKSANKKTNSRFAFNQNERKKKIMENYKGNQNSDQKQKSIKRISFFFEWNQRIRSHLVPKK